MADPKVLQGAAFRLNAGNTVNLPPSGGDWLGEDTFMALAGAYMFPHFSIGNAVNVETEEDNSVIGRAFMSTPRMTGKMIDNPISCYDRFEGLDDYDYWNWGFCNDLKKVIVFKGADPATAFVGGAIPAAGELAYEDATAGTPQIFTFVRHETTKTEPGVEEHLYVFTPDTGVTAPDPTPAGTLIQTSAPATNNFTYTEHSVVLEEKLFEIDSLGRQLREYTTPEIAMDDYVAGKKNPFASVAKRFTPYDMEFDNVVSSGFTWSTSAPGGAKLEGNFLSPRQRRNSTTQSSPNWTLPDGLENNRSVPFHHQMQFWIGTDPSSLECLGMTELSYEVTPPLEKIQTTKSGLSLAEPYIEGKYTVGLTGTVGRHSVETYQNYRDLQTLVVAKIKMSQGYNVKTVYFKECNIIASGPDDTNVASEPLQMGVGYARAADDQWATTELTNHTQIHESPAVMLVRSPSSVNPMFKE